MTWNRPTLARKKQHRHPWLRRLQLATAQAFLFPPNHHSALIYLDKTTHFSKEWLVQQQKNKKRQGGNKKKVVVCLFLHGLNSFARISLTNEHLKETKKNKNFPK